MAREGDNGGDGDPSVAILPSLGGVGHAAEQTASELCLQVQEGCVTSIHGGTEIGDGARGPGTVEMIGRWEAIRGDQGFRAAQHTSTRVRIF